MKPPDARTRLRRINDGGWTGLLDAGAPASHRSTSRCFTLFSMTAKLTAAVSPFPSHHAVTQTGWALNQATVLALASAIENRGRYPNSRLARLTS